MTQSVPQQIVLDVELPDEQTFSTFVEAQNSVAVSHCQQLLERKITPNMPFLTFLSGATGAGKSHLMVAMCHKASELGLSQFYLCLEDDMEFPAEILNAMEHVDLLCIDNIQRLQSKPEWQIALFDLVNRIKESPRCCLVVSADKGPLSLELELPDLKSRLSWGVSFHLTPLNEIDAEAALVKKAEHRGIVISPESIRFLISHCRRDMQTLTSTLEYLQNKSLELKRKISIPLIKLALDI